MQAKNGISKPTDSIPVLYCRGTHYEVGFKIGHTFRSMIQDLLGTWKYFNNVVLKLGSTNEGQVLMQQSLQLCNAKFPGYVSEIRGMADGAGIEFEKLFMLNIDSVVCSVRKSHVLDHDAEEETKKSWGAGCTTIICNKGEVVLGHTEDAMTEIQDHIYIVSAEILNSSYKATGGNEYDSRSVVLEKFTTLCYAGTLMGYTMGYNSHGMIYSVNTIFPSVYTAGTPRAFVARSLLGASDFPNLLSILRDKGNGIADGFSLNVYFYPKTNTRNIMEDHENDSKLLFYNIEVAPPKLGDNNEIISQVNDNIVSVVDIHKIESGTAFTHCNRYLRVSMNECNPIALEYSDKRDAVLCQHHERVKCVDSVKAALSDQTDCDFPIYNDGNQENNGEEFKMSFIRTVAIGIFNIHERTWDVYDSAPNVAEPVHRFVIE